MPVLFNQNIVGSRPQNLRETPYVSEAQIKIYFLALLFSKNPNAPFSQSEAYSTQHSA